MERLEEEAEEAARRLRSARESVEFFDAVGWVAPLKRQESPEEER